ncbi:BamA/TamA family outer membrane protein [Candidatus Poribacteria bacterium]
MKKVLVIILQVLPILLMITANPGYSSASEAENTAEDDGSGSSLGAVPMIGYSPETKLLFGAAGIYTFHMDKHGGRPSSIPVMSIYTQKKQYSIGLAPELYLSGDRYRVTGGISFAKFPDKFYGIGNNTLDDMEEDYTPQWILFNAGLQRRIYIGLNFGVQYEFEKSKVTEADPDGLLATGQIDGSEGGINSGAGLLMNWDDRDNIFFPTAGRFYQISSMTYTDILGSDYEFTRLGLDLRQYIPILPSHTLALQGLINYITGDPPFHKLSLLGGQNIVRGYYLGRYREKNMIAFQMEYRVLPVWWRRLGVVGFYGLGAVANEMSDFELDDFKHSVGVGLRFQLDTKERVNFRVDYAYGKDSSGIYITALEAF